MTNRRDLLKGAGAIAGAFALPTTVKAAGQAFDAAVPNELPCPRCRYLRRDARALSVKAMALYDRLHKQLSREQQDLLSEYSDAAGEQDVVEQDQFVEELARHLPGLRPAIWLVADHLISQTHSDIGTCCEA